MSKRYEYHPIAEEIPRWGSDSFEKLCEDIATNGLVNSIVLYDGKILDGRHRYEACLEAGVKPSFREYKGDDPVGHVLSLNLLTRDWKPGQKAMIASNLANLSRGGNGANQYGSKCANLRNSEVSQSDAAEQMGVSRRTVQTAKKIRNKANKAITKMVEDGDISVNAGAALADLPKKKQEAIAKGGVAAAKKEIDKLNRKKKLSNHVSAPKDYNYTMNFSVLMNLADAFASEEGLAGRSAEDLATLLYSKMMYIQGNQDEPVHMSQYRKSLDNIEALVERLYEVVQVLKSDSLIHSVN